MSGLKMKLRSSTSKTEEQKETNNLKEKDIYKLPYIKYFGNIYYFTDSIDCAIHCDKILSQAKNSDSDFVIGFDMEWPFNFRTGPSKAALIQLSPTLNDCFLFHVSRFKTLPKALTELLLYPTVRLVGVNIKNDIRKLSRDFPGIDDDTIIENCIDLRTQANNVLNCTRRWSMANLINHILKKQINKDKNIRNSKWNVIPLSDSQKLYAAIDAYASLQLYLHLRDLEMKGVDNCI